jgi:hypothetical protein
VDFLTSLTGARSHEVPFPDVDQDRKRSRRLSILGAAKRRSADFPNLMQYVMLFYTDSARWAELSKEERNRIHEECGAWHQELVKSGRYRGAVGLQPVTTATTVAEKSGDFVITDGPFAETREVLGGFETVECKDLDEAIAIAKRFPALRAGALVEVRPIVAGGECRE